MIKQTKHWDKIGFKEHNGINVPLFSLYSNESCGVGEFTDLIPLISWCSEVSFDVIQLLPLNDTGREESPYSALSAFALNPIHLGLSALPFVKEEPALFSLLPKMQAFNQLKRCDYPAVHQLKNSFLKKYYELKSDQIIESEQFKIFKQENSWAESYALFKTLRIKENWRGFESFPEDLQNPNLLYYTELLNLYRDDVRFHIFVQYLCFKQFEYVKKFANENNVFLMGDIPILINRDSADVWALRSLFDLRYCAGAPPDKYTPSGQNWGFPTYNWKQIEEEKFHWWKLRLKVASKLYDIYRIDHIVGFFHIWSIPYEFASTNGYYVPKDFCTAMKQGEKILEMMVASSPMLPIGEDLGIVPDEVRSCMSRLNICGTKVMRWERKWNEDNRFLKPEEYPALSLTTVSTHDSETVKLWWRDQKIEAMDYAEEKKFVYNDDITDDQLTEILRESLHTKSLFHINLLQEYLNLVKEFTFDDLEDERVNVPGTVSDFNWTFRYLKPVEDIVENKELKTKIKNLLKK